MLHVVWLPLLAALRDDLLVDGDLGVDDLVLRVIYTERGIEERMVLERLIVDVADELALYLVEIYGSFDSANIV